METMGYEVSNTRKVTLPEGLRGRQGDSKLLGSEKLGRLFVRAKVDPSAAPQMPSGHGITVKATISNQEDYARAYAFAKEWDLWQRSSEKRDYTSAFRAGLQHMPSSQREPASGGSANAVQ